VAELLSYLGDRGVVPGANLSVVEVVPLKGPLTLKLGTRIISMSREVARYVWVKKSE
jgi:Fe2+ transport system protein FeoA